MTIIDKLKWRYATKKFNSNKYIAQDKIELLKEAFNLTATSYGLQPVKLLFIKDKELQEKLVPVSMDQEQVYQASHVMVFCIEKYINQEYIEAYFDRIKHIRNTPEHILKPFEEFLIEDFKGKSVEAVQDWATKQAYLAMGNLLTVLAVEDIDACPMEGFSPNDYDEILKLESKNLKSVLVMPIGYRAEDDLFSGFKKVRKSVAESTFEL